MKIIVASNNENKVQEIRAMLPSSITLLSLQDVNCTEDIPETADTIEGNAILKANYASKKYGLPCFADDTGLEVKELNNAPGVLSARYAGEDKNSEKNMDKLLLQLQDKKSREAQFKTVIALCMNAKQYLFTGIAKGKITYEKKGKEGFGYDPIFMPEGYSQTFAEISLNEKARISHRGKAVRKLLDFLNNL